MPSLSEPSPTVASSGVLTRREALRFLAAQMAVTLASCSKPDEEIVPYVRMPEQVVPGEPLRFATSLPLAGYARGVLAISVDGRPIKIEGNPLHPASLGATDLFAEAAVLSLYDPDRSRTVLRNGGIASWQMFFTALLPELERLAGQKGRGLRLLTGRVSSPTLARQIDQLLQQFPQAVWHAYEPVDDDAVRDGARLAYGRPLTPIPDLARARCVLALDADPLGPGPEQIRNGRGFVARRDPNAAGADFSRWYVLESTPTLTGVKADNRLALHPYEIHNAAIALANELGAALPITKLSAEASRFIAAAAQDLKRSAGGGLVSAGRTLSQEVHALVHWINARLDAPTRMIEPPDQVLGGAPASIAALANALEAGDVEVLAILDADPVYDAPADLNFAERLAKARFSLHHGAYVDETAARCLWHVPASHPLESWSDLRASDGVASLVQPLIKPLYATRTGHELLAAFLGAFEASAYDLVRATWRATGVDDFEGWWRRALHDGVLADSAAKPAVVAGPRLPNIAPKPVPDTLDIILAPDPSLWDGRFANNAWLQECPKPITKQVWGNAIGLGPADAQRLGLSTGDLVRVEAQDRALVAPVVVSPGHAQRVASMTLGYGRSKAGMVGNDIGANAYALRTTQTPWLIEAVELTRTGARGADHTELCAA